MGFPTELNFTQRDYQNYYLQKAIEQNTIICLGTGSGKTYITILLLRHFGDKIKQEKKKAIFLATTQPLVVQQSEEIKKHINFITKAFYGDSNGAHTWDKEKWRKEIDSNDVLVFTPNIFAEILCKQIIKLDQICVMIFDECHWGSCKRKGNGVVETGHIYRKMMDFVKDQNYHNKIRIVGTTASVVNACLKPEDLPICCDMLEYTFNAKIMGEFEFDSNYLAQPNIEVWLYKNQFGLNSNLIEYQKLYDSNQKLDSLITKYTNKDNEQYYKNMLNIFDFVDQPIISLDILRRMIRDLMDVHCELGLFCAFLLCRKFSEELDDKLLIPSDDTNKRLINLVKRFLTFMDELYLKMIRKLVKQNKNDKQVMLELSTPKLLRLLDVIHSHTNSNDNFSILVFVDRVIFCFVIYQFIDQFNEKNKNNQIKSNFFVGNNTDYSTFKFIRQSTKNFEATIKMFKAREYNLIITTAVLEEGIDIGACNLVIRFSEPVTYREFVQSKGRARAKNSRFVILQDEYYRLKGLMNLFKRTEIFLNFKFKQNKQDENNKSILPDSLNISTREECLRSKTGSLLEMCQAGQFMQRYIIKKGNNNIKAEYSYENFDLRDQTNELHGERSSDVESKSAYRFTLNLQGVTPLVDEVIGKLYSNPVDAFKSAMLAACKKLYEIGQLDDNFIPISNDALISRYNLIKKHFSDEERKEMNFIFQIEGRQRFMFEKEMSRYDFFKQFTRSSGFNVYELEFISKDPQLQDNKERLALITELDLASDSRFELFNVLYSANIRLKLIERGISLTKLELETIGTFTLSAFKTVIPVFSLRSDLKFDIQKCLFKLAFLTDQNLIDFLQMNKYVHIAQQPLDVESLFDQGKELIVRPIHKFTDYRLIRAKTHTFITEEFEHDYLRISFIDYYERYHDLILRNQFNTMYKVEQLNHFYSISAQFNTENEKTKEINKFSLCDRYLPKELVTVSLSDNNLNKKLNCIPLLIHRIKQRLILRTFWLNLNKKVLNIKTKQKFEDIFNTSQTVSQTNIDEYMTEVSTKWPGQNKALILDETIYYDTSDDEIMEDEMFEDKLAQKSREIEEKISESSSKTKKDKHEEKIIKANKFIIYPSVSQQKLDKYLNEILFDTLQKIGYSNVDDFLKVFFEQFEKLIIQLNQQVTDLEVSNEINFKHPVTPMTQSKTLKNINFDIWTTENSDQNLISMPILIESLTSESAEDVMNYERFEFLGDCFLKLVTCCLLFHLYPNLCVGELDILKNSAVCNKSLYMISRRNQLYKYLFAEKLLPGINSLPDGFEFTGEMAYCVQRRVTVVDSSGFRLEPLKLIDQTKYQELKPKTLSDGIESLIGGVLLSSGIRNACLLMKSLGIYSNEFVLDLNCEQKDWFNPKYNPIEHDPTGNLSKFVSEMYKKFDLKSLETRIGYSFKNKALLVQAFKHVSYRCFKEFPSYERLEFYGDAVIDYLIVRYFFDIQNNKFTPGKLTLYKQSLNNNQFFGTLSVKYGLNNHLIYRDPTLFNSICKFKDYFLNTSMSKGDMLVIPNSYIILELQSNYNFDEDVYIPKVLGDIFESLMGSIFIDSEFSFNAVWNVMHRFMINELKQFLIHPPKTFLQLVHELYPQNLFTGSRIENQMNKIDFVIGDKKFTGIGSTKRLAKMNVAKQVIKFHLSQKKNLSLQPIASSTPKR